MSNVKQSAHSCRKRCILKKSLIINKIQQINNRKVVCQNTAAKQALANNEPTQNA